MKKAEYLPMGPMKYDEGPEVAPQQASLEVYHSPQSYPSSPQPSAFSPVQRQDSSFGQYSATTVDRSVYAHAVLPHPQSAYHMPAVESPPTKKYKKTICGCTVLVFILSTIIAALAAAVIGLAAGTGVEASRAQNALEQLAALQALMPTGTATATSTTAATATSASASATATSFASISNDCSNADETTTGQTYTTDFFGKVTYTMFCNSNAPNVPIMSLFTANFNNCMDACAAFASSRKAFAANTTCAGVSFIPLWTTRQGAVEGKAPGNCYLKPGPQTRSGLETPNIGTECHAAILNSS
ncbi:uncharacterized protein CTRU02_212088 [Colletotrichum truncatum]|uniref:Uncharacterized protein n=1 Tax=Colletotrichum truncatum TaxID=5467 RepID=A0ACC3YMJ5_COLTU|nr:uncharacterized protein CTRU02_06841 [Colletotrichum truncatum]KAF6792224.1 hypothetical protein CTRU02_06841 [Colletotrichum truncatum]